MNVKRLNLDKWMMRNDNVFEETVKQYEPFKRIFGKPGIYLYGDKCWFELPNGKSYLYSKEIFEYVLKMEEVKKLNQYQIEALRNIVKQKLATKEQRNLLYHYECMMMTRKTKRNTKLMMSKLKG